MLEKFSQDLGVNIWENEGSGIQINVGVRGLSPNRDLGTKHKTKATTFLQTFWISKRDTPGGRTKQ
jgi:hypothetical protein